MLLLVEQQLIENYKLVVDSLDWLNFFFIANTYRYKIMYRNVFEDSHKNSKFSEQNLVLTIALTNLQIKGNPNPLGDVNQMKRRREKKKVLAV